MKSYTGKSKLSARLDTIIKPYRKIFNKSVPKNEQYWALAGSVLNENNQFSQDSEISQILSARLIRPGQFFGVDLNSVIIKKNKEKAPDFNWINSSFIRAMEKEYKNNNFRPAIVNLDHTSMPKEACKDFLDIFYFLSNLKKKNILLVFNSLIKNPYGNEKVNPEIVIDILNNDKMFRDKIGGWNYESKHYKYNGAGCQSNSELATFMFWK